MTTKEQVFNLLVIIASGVMLADLVVNYKGTQTLLTGLTNLWSTSIQGLLASQSTAPAPVGGTVRTA